MKILFLTLIINVLSRTTFSAEYSSHVSRYKNTFIKFMIEENIYLWEVTPYKTDYTTTISYKVKAQSPQRLQNKRYYCEGPIREPDNPKLRKYVKRPKPYVIILKRGPEKKYYIIR